VLVAVDLESIVFLVAQILLQLISGGVVFGQVVNRIFAQAVRAQPVWGARLEYSTRRAHGLELNDDHCELFATWLSATGCALIRTLVRH
jgi:hypothetical protein